VKPVLPAPIRARRPHERRRRTAAFSLVEIMVASITMTIVVGGIFATIIQSRRLTEGSIFQNSTVTVMQGYLEQMKNMEFSQLTVSAATQPGTARQVATMLDQNTPDPLVLSWGSPPNAMPAIGTVPTGAVNNIKVIDINNTPGNPNDNLTMNLWIWVQDLTGQAADVRDAKSITIIYTWQFTDGGRTRTYRDTVRTVRSLVPTF
jgi:Tfp pilus assembly protein PilV